MLTVPKVIKKCYKMSFHPYAANILRVVFTASKGGATRTRIVIAIRKRPLNANRLANALGLDYKSISHHLNVLEKNNLVRRMGDTYGSTYSVSTFLAVNFETFDRIVQEYIRNYKDEQLRKSTSPDKEIKSTKSWSLHVRSK